MTKIVYVNPGEMIEFRFIHDPEAPKVKSEWVHQVRPDRVTIAFDSWDQLAVSLPMRTTLREIGGNATYAPTRTSDATKELVTAFRSVRQILDGSQPRDLPGALMIIDAALGKVGHQ